MKDQFIGGDAETPPVDLPGIALLVNDLGCHVCHASCDTGVEASI